MELSPKRLGWSGHNLGCVQDRVQVHHRTPLSKDTNGSMWSCLSSLTLCVLTVGMSPKLQALRPCTSQWRQGWSLSQSLALLEQVWACSFSGFTPAALWPKWLKDIQADYWRLWLRHVWSQQQQALRTHTCESRAKSKPILSTLTVGVGAWLQQIIPADLWAQHLRDI